MKKVIYLSIFCLIGILTINSCQSEAISSENNLENLNLKSPNGKSLAENLSDLEVYIKSTSQNEINNITFSNIKYFESENYSFGIIDYFEDEEFKSMFKVIELDDNYMLLTDKHTIEVVKSSSEIVNNSNDKQSIISYNQKSGVGSAKCQGGNCCSWEQTGANRFNCGCPATLSVIITTSDGCEVEL